MVFIIACPRCHELPHMTIFKDGSVELECLKHDYNAFGNTYDGAAILWNSLINFIVKSWVQP